MTISLRGFHIRLSAKIITSMLCALGACAAGYLVAHQKFSELGLLLIAVSVYGILARPRIGFYLFIAFLFIPIDYLERSFFSVPNVFRWLPHFFLLVTAVVFVLKAKWSTGATLDALFPHHLRLFGILLLALSVLSGIYNHSSLLVTVLGSRFWLFLYGVFALFRVALPSPSARVSVLKFLLTIGLIQLPVTLVQRGLFGMQPAGIVLERLYEADLVTGTFSVYTDLLFLQVFCVVLVTIWWLKGQRLLFISPGLTLVLLVLPLVVSNAKAAWLYLPVCILFVMRKHLLRWSKRSLGILALLFTLVVVGALGFEVFFQISYGESQSAIALITNADSMVEYLFAIEKDPDRPDMLARGEAVVFNYGLIRRDPITLLIGLGPGNLSHSHIQSGRYVESSIAPRLGTASTQLCIVLGEMGVVGVLLMAWFLIGLYRMSSRDVVGEDDKFIELRKAAVWWIALLVPYYSVLWSLLVAAVLAAMFAPMTATRRQRYDSRLEGKD